MNGAVQVCRCSRCVAGLRVLCLDAGATPESIHEAFLDLAKVWHPDRFEADHRLKARAEEQFKLLQVAVRELREHFQRPEAAANLQRRREDDPDSRVGYRADGEFSRARDLFRNLVDGERYFLHPHIPDYAVERVRKCDCASADSLVGFVDRSMTRTGRSFLAFTEDSLLARETFLMTRIPYAELGHWSIVLTLPGAPGAHDRLTDKGREPSGEQVSTLNLRNGDDLLRDAVTFSRRAQAEVFAALIRELQHSGTF